MKRLAWFAPLLFLAISTPAQHRNLFSRTARLAGRTLVNMATCRDKIACVEEWGVMFSGSMDSYETGQYLHFCPSCRETNPVLGLRPSQGRTWGTVMSFSFVMAMQTQGFRERMRNQDNRLLRDFVPATPSAVYIGIELNAFKVNYATAGKFKRCAATPGCFR